MPGWRINAQELAAGISPVVFGHGVIAPREVDLNAPFGTITAAGVWQPVPMPMPGPIRRSGMVCVPPPSATMPCAAPRAALRRRARPGG
ncbi:MAG: hypothetical protein ACK4MR_02930 [Erythrobacter cryptus]